MEYVMVGKKQKKYNTVKKMRLVFLISGALLAIAGAGTVNPILFIIGALLLINYYRYSKALKTVTRDQSYSTSAKSSNNEIAPACKIEKHHVAGVTFENRQQKIEQMGFQNEDYYLSKQEFIDSFSEYEKVYAIDFDPIKVDLVEEPDNPHDPNAIKVIVDGVHVGYIKSGSCAHVKKLLHSDSIISIKAEIGGGNYKYLSEEETIEKDSSNFFVTLHVKIKT